LAENAIVEKEHHCSSKRFDVRVPEPGDIGDEDRALLPRVEAGFRTVGDLPQERLQVPRCSFGSLRTGLGEAIGPPKA